MQQRSLGMVRAHSMCRWVLLLQTVRRAGCLTSLLTAAWLPVPQTSSSRELELSAQCAAQADRNSEVDHDCCSQSFPAVVPELGSAGDPRRQTERAHPRDRDFRRADQYDLVTAPARDLYPVLAVPSLAAVVLPLPDLGKSSCVDFLSSSSLLLHVLTPRRRCSGRYRFLHRDPQCTTRLQYWIL